MRYDMFIVISFFTYFRSWKWLVWSLKLHWWGMSSDMYNSLCLSHSSLNYLFSQTMSGMSDLCLAPHVLQGVLFWSYVWFLPVYFWSKWVILSRTIFEFPWWKITNLGMPLKKSLYWGTLSKLGEGVKKRCQMFQLKIPF